MPIRLNKPALAALGLLKVLRGGKAEGIRSGTRDPGADHRGLPAFDDLVEAGEEVYDELLLRAKNRRDHFETDFRNGLSKVLSDLGIATRDEIRDLRDEMGKDNQDPAAPDRAPGGNDGTSE